MDLRIKEICRAKGVTITQLAEKLSIKQESLSRAINGNPTKDTLERIASVLDVPVADLFDQPASDIVNCPKCGAKLKIVKEDETAE